MKAHEFLALGLQSGDRVNVTTAEGKNVETTFDGVKAWCDVIRNPDVQLSPRFRAPTIDFGGDMTVPFQRITKIEKIQNG